MFSRQTADLLTVASDRIIWVLIGMGLLELWHLIFTAFGRIWYAGLLHKLKSYGISSHVFQVMIFCLFSEIDDFRCFWIGSIHKRIQSMLAFHMVTFLALHFSYYTLMIFLMMISVILLSLYTKWDQASDLWLQLEMAPELGSDLRDTVDCGKKWFVDFNARKTQLVSHDKSNNSGAI